MNAASRVVGPERAAESARRWREAGERVALARGDFDLLTVDHVHQLSAVRARADRLVVAVRGDRAAGGAPGRPVLPARDRAALVAALRGVDLVLVLEDAPAGGRDVGLAADVEVEVPGGRDPAARMREAGGGAS